ncbi:MAG: hypothetical protein R6X02_25805 [Enhygromyxa sp.]
MSYEQATNAARLAPLTLPPFKAIADAAQRDREAWSREDRDRRARARRWLLASAALWLLLPLDAFAPAMIGAPGASWSLGFVAGLDVALMVLPPASISIWGARLTRDRGFRSAILSRAIAASNLVVALLYAASVGGMFGAVFSSLLALASARSLMLLGERGLDGSDDPSSEFEPVRFRGVLIVALIMSFADALTLGFSSAVAGVRTLGVARAGLDFDGSSLALTLAAALVMVVNVWGLARLRTWALFGTLLSNLGIAAAALHGMLAVNIYVSIALAVTAVMQLLCLVPVFAAALGDQQAGRSHELLGRFLRVLVPGLVVVTIVMAAINFDLASPSAWSTPRWPSSPW